MTDPTWETCEIETADSSNWLGTKTRFAAVAVGPKGRYTVATSEEWRGWVTTDRYPTHLDPLIRRLLAEGWESDGKGTSN